MRTVWKCATHLDSPSRRPSVCAGHMVLPNRRNHYFPFCPRGPGRWSGSHPLRREASSCGGAKLAPPQLSELAQGMVSARLGWCWAEPGRTCSSRGGGNLPPPRMSELARVHLHLCASCSRLCTVPVPVDVPLDVPHGASRGMSQVGDMAATRADACPPTRGHDLRSKHRNCCVLARGPGTATGPAGSTCWPAPGGPGVRTCSCVEDGFSARALRTPRGAHTKVCRHVCAGQVRAPLRPCWTHGDSVRTRRRHRRVRRIGVRVVWWRGRAARAL
ncbi:hypothetical protein FHX71_002720 [Promicromonospora sukumoe]|uniref:Uncharacterized protein n=1 Tax=Promicromonospora sukumoe TaxID=88382 RepID=A0A7W3J9J8_9MICO|nr:hypothetical protein [Promicromonospora sukumoe]